jgi:hypothetical protein
MQGTRRTIATAAASFAVVLGVGGVAAATSGHGSHTGSTTPTSLPGAHQKPAKATVRAHLPEASSTTETDDDTATTVEEKPSTGVRVHTPDTVENDLRDDEGDDQGEATEEAHENENADLEEHDEKPSTAVGDSTNNEVEDDRVGASHQGGDRSGSDSEIDDGGHGGTD